MEDQYGMKYGDSIRSEVWRPIPGEVSEFDQDFRRAKPRRRSSPCFESHMEIISPCAAVYDLNSENFNIINYDGWRPGLGVLIYNFHPLNESMEP